MALPSAPIQTAAYGTGAPNVIINVNAQPPMVQQDQPVIQRQPAAGQLPAHKSSKATSSFLGRFVETITQSKKYQKAAAFTEKTFKPLKEWAIDFSGALKILGKETWKGVSYGALAGLGAGAVATFLCPPLFGPAFTTCVTAGITGGGIIGYLSGAAKASDYYTQARQARKDEAELIQKQNIEPNPFSHENV